MSSFCICTSFNGLTWCRIFFLPLIVRPPMWFPCKLGASASGFEVRDMLTTCWRTRLALTDRPPRCWLAGGPDTAQQVINARAVLAHCIPLRTWTVGNGDTTSWSRLVQLPWVLPPPRLRLGAGAGAGAGTGPCTVSNGAGAGTRHLCRYQHVYEDDQGPQIQSGPTSNYDSHLWITV